VKRPNEVERFEMRTSRSDSDGCWHWTGKIHQQGYGEFWRDGGAVLAHRWAYEQTYGLVPHAKRGTAMPNVFCRHQGRHLPARQLRPAS
jgi:hypothetical protein